MKKLKAIAGFVIAPWILAGCDTEQPLSGGPRTISLDVRVTTLLRYFPAWDRYRDFNGNGALDAGEPLDGLECTGELEWVVDGNIQIPAPWGFNAEINLVRGGTVERVALLPSSAATGFNNFPTAPDFPTAFPPFEPFPVDPPGADFGTFVYVNPRRLASTNRALLQCLIPGTEFPPANIAGLPLPVEGTLEPDDTVIFRLGKDDAPLVPAWADFPGSFSAIVRIDGALVTPMGTSSTTEPQETLYFSYQSR